MSELLFLSLSTLVEAALSFVLARIVRRSADVHLYQIVGIICLVFALLSFIVALIA